VNKVDNEIISRILVVGLGSIGKRHLRLVRELIPGADIRVMRHQPCSQVPEFSDGCVSDMQAAMEFAPQIAVIASPAPFHIQTATKLAEIGCHLLIEKPLSHNSDGIEQLVELEMQYNLVIQVGYNLRFHEALIRYRELIQSGVIGNIMSIRCEVGQYLPAWRPDVDYRLGVSARRDLGGGVLLELSHELDYMRWIFGEALMVSAWVEKLSGLEVDVEDSVFLTMGFASDAIAYGAVASICIDFVRHDTTRNCIAIGDQGSLRWNGVSGEIECWKKGGTDWELLFQYQSQRDDTYRAEWKHFLECVQNGEKPRVVLDDGLAVMKVIDAAKASGDKAGVRIEVEDNR